MNYQLSLAISLLLLLSSCRVYEAQTFDFEKPVDTTTRPIEMQEKKLYELGGVYADNRFDGARLNDFSQITEGLYQATIEPENMPINPSPYYAFKLWSEEAKGIALKLKYTDAKHRYHPKISSNGIDWQPIPKSSLIYEPDSINVIFPLDLSQDTLWVAAQEIQNSTHVREWCIEMAQHSDAQFSVVGKSKLGRDMYFLDIGNGAAKKKDIIAIVSRQHPPEVTGYLAMKAFVEEIMSDTPLSNDFRKKYRVVVFPLMNPDGVDLGHWRHNAGGIDLNRDWAMYNQEENRIVVNHIVRTAAEARSQVILGLDFHSTYYDIFYTNQYGSEDIPNFKDYWLQGIDVVLGEVSRRRPSYPQTPVSKNWFFKQFGAEGVVYEIGDDTPRDFIERKGKVSAMEMIELLILR